MDRFSGTRNYLYFGALGAEVSTGALAGEKYFKITAKGEFSVFPAEAEVGDVIYNKPAIELSAGDKARPFTLKRLAFVSNIPQGAQKEKYENTVQIDSAKSYEEGDKPDITGTIDGYFTDDEYADYILKRFFRLVDDDGAGNRIYAPLETGPLHFFLGRKETTKVGEKEVMEYMPSIIDSLTVDKPMNGPQTFNFAYTVIGNEMPSIFRRKITA